MAKKSKSTKKYEYTRGELAKMIGDVRETVESLSANLFDTSPQDVDTALTDILSDLEAYAEQVVEEKYEG